MGEKFCLSGGIPNFLLGFRTPDEVRSCCKKVIEGVGRDGGYVLDASAIIQNDAKVENFRAMTDAALEYGVYSRGHCTCVSWDDAKSRMPAIQGGGTLCRRIWESTDAMAAMYVWRVAWAF